MIEILFDDIRQHGELIICWGCNQFTELCDVLPMWVNEFMPIGAQYERCDKKCVGEILGSKFPPVKFESSIQD
jgi:hypothetical protein